MSQYDRCPNPDCQRRDDLWVYRCNNCGFEGCCSEDLRDGCFREQYCPKCDQKSYNRVGYIKPR
jgi:predicted nucleic acid binding AN1-type Zn finger protein